MALKATDYIAKLPEAERSAIEAEAERLIAEELALAELREARQRSQAGLDQPTEQGDPTSSAAGRTQT